MYGDPRDKGKWNSEFSSISTVLKRRMNSKRCNQLHFPQTQVPLLERHPPSPFYATTGFNGRSRNQGFGAYEGGSSLYEVSRENRAIYTPGDYTYRFGTNGYAHSGLPRK